MSANMKKAAQIAEEAAKKFGTEDEIYLKLCSLMCWNAVKYCAYLSKLSLLRGKFTETNKEMMEALFGASPIIADATAMGRIPRGHVLAFFRGTDAVHAMISLGAGMAAGCKNGCCIPDDPYKEASVWEKLDLNTLAWGVNSYIDGDNRATVIRHRPITCW